eukprot:gene20245-24240_t
MTDHTDDHELHFGDDVSLAPLEDDSRLLANLLDDCCRMEVGEMVFRKLQTIRTLATSASTMFESGAEDAGEWLFDRLRTELTSLSFEELVPVVRACTHYLNFTTIAETHHRVRRFREGVAHSTSYDTAFGRVLAMGHSEDALYEAVCTQQVEVVLTAHPTQVNRRTIQYKHTKIASLLERNDRPDLTTEEKETVIEEIAREIISLWQTDELRRKKPTPLDEARGGLHIVEQSLWSAVPNTLRRTSHALKKHTGKPLPLECVPVKFGSWMGGDRDGNPNVTAKVTKHVAYLAKWMACDLYIREIDALRFELSMVCYRSLWDCGAGILAEGRLLDTIRRTYVFGFQLMKLDMRQESTRHTKALDTITNYLGLGSYVSWDEPKRIEWLSSELNGRRPLIAPVMDMPDDVKEVLDTFKCAAELGSSAIGAYVISMASNKSPAASNPTPFIKTSENGSALKEPQSPKGELKSALKSTTKQTVDKMLNSISASGCAPYRVVLGSLREKLISTRFVMEELMAGNTPSEDLKSEVFGSIQDFTESLLDVASENPNPSVTGTPQNSALNRANSGLGYVDLCQLSLGSARILEGMVGGTHPVYDKETDGSAAHIPLEIPYFISETPEP